MSRGSPPGREEYLDSATEPTPHGRPRTASVRQFEVVVTEGVRAGTTWRSSGERCSIGSHPSNEVVIEDPTISRFHCELRASADGLRLRDLGSRNGTNLDGVIVVEGFPRNGSLVRLGRSALHVRWEQIENRLPVSDQTRFGGLVGSSLPMRAMFAILERAAASDATVLIEGETGAGKEVVAAALHDNSTRAAQPLVVVDCGAIPGALLESELFGHERGAFTGAETRRIGAAEEAHGSTLFLDEVGELAPDLQPKLLRLLEQRTVRRVGSNVATPVDLRVIAATNRDLRKEVNEGRFRSDLYFRLAVVKINVPPLRERMEDIPLLVEAMLQRHDKGDADFLREPEFLATLQRTSWPGNVRELQNHLMRCLVYRSAVPFSESAHDGGTANGDVSYEEARRRAIAQFERSWLESLLARHGGRVAAAARASGLNRIYLHRLIKRHGLGGRQGGKGDS